MRPTALLFALVFAALALGAPVQAGPPDRVVTVTLVRWPYT